MTDYTELVKALRYCVNARDCKKCAYRINNNSVKCRIQRVENAAAAIEALQAEAQDAAIEYAIVCKKLGELKQQMPKRGEWIIKGQGIFCSLCGVESAFNWWGASKFSNYCPNCGADMRKMEVQDGQ